MNYPLFVARRLRLTSKKGRGTPPGIIIAVTGIALALVIMMLAMSIVLGFKNEIKHKVMGFDAHIAILPASYDGDEPNPFLDVTPELTDIIDGIDGIESSSLTLVQSAILKTDNDFEGIMIKGLPQDGSMDFINSHIVEGAPCDYSDPECANDVSMSKTTANLLNLGVGDKVYAYFFIDGAVKPRRLRIASIYDTHFSDYDKNYVFSSLKLLQGVNGIDSLSGNRLQMTVTDIDHIDDTALELQNAMIKASYNDELQGVYRLTTVTETGMMYFNWLELLDTNVVVIIILMILVSGFTLVSSLFIIILERINLIGIFKALGATNGEVRRIFIYLGQKLVLRGMLIGNIAGIAVLLLQSKLHFLPLDPEAHYLNYVPVEIDWINILLLNIGVFVVSWAMIILPCHIVSSIKPSQSIRYE